MPDFDAETFAQIATGDGDVDAGDDVQEASGADNHAEAEGGPEESDVGSESSIREMFMSSEPNPRLEDVDDPWNPELGGRTRIYRGLQKMMDISGMPAIIDIVVGGMEMAKDAQSSLSASDDGDQEESDDDRSSSADTGDDAPAAPDGVPVA